MASGFSHSPARQPDRKSLRQQLRALRRSLSRQQQQQASERLALNLGKTASLRRARHIAVYLPNDGEIDPREFVHGARKRGVSFYLPVLHPIHRGRLVFAPWSGSTPLRRNRFGIPEPAFATSQRPAWALDAVLMPLVGFDREGGRLGMGGGFYDRTFAFSRRYPRLCPALIGLAHQCQQVERLPTASWDIALRAVVSDSCIIETDSA